VDKKQRADNTFIYAAKLKRELQEYLVDAKITIVPVGIMGADDAPLQLVVVGSDLDSAMDFARKAEAELLKIAGTSEVELSVEDGNPEITVQVDRDKMSRLRSEEHTSELQSRENLVCRLLLEKKKK